MSGRIERQLKEFMTLPKDEQVKELADSFSQLRLCPICESLCNKKLEQCYERDYVFLDKESE